ncbi:MarC family protein [Henriciella sp. AS95]|uniref:MarC family protein n=1 Tax=Henriciella sp. AS95 TaxID=3135782 RepID=UPI0031740F6A
MSHNLLEQFILLWVVIDPIGTIPVFIAVTASVAAEKRWKIAIQAVFAATMVLLLFLIGGQFLINALGISLPAFQIAGGIVLLLFALTMIFGDSKPESEAEGYTRTKAEGSVAIFPLAMPSLASPGAILAIVVLTDNNRFSIEQQAVTAGIMLLVMLAALILMLSATPILKVIRMTGAALVSRIMGMILAAVAVNTVILAVIELIRTVEI